MRPGNLAALLLAAAAALLGVRSVRDRRRLERVEVASGAWRVVAVSPLPSMCPPDCSCRGVLAVLDEIEREGRAA